MHKIILFLDNYCSILKQYLTPHPQMSVIFLMYQRQTRLYHRIYPIQSAV